MVSARLPARQRTLLRIIGICAALHSAGKHGTAPTVPRGTLRLPGPARRPASEQTSSRNTAGSDLESQCLAERTALPSNPP
jgi:hypothetical protein